MRWAGLAAFVAGLCYIVVGLFHPANVPSSVTTTTWAYVHYAATAMGFFGLFGMAGLYSRQVDKIGWLGTAGFVLFSLWLGLMMCVSFIEAFILPLMAVQAPAFVAGFVGMFTGVASQVDLGALPTLWNISGPMYILGGLLFGIGTFRARVLSRWAAALVGLGTALGPVAAFFPPQLTGIIAVPVGLGLAWLGYSLMIERREKTTEAAPQTKGAKSGAASAA